MAKYGIYKVMSGVYTARYGASEAAYGFYTAKHFVLPSTPFMLRYMHTRLSLHSSYLTVYALHFGPTNIDPVF